MSNSWLSRGDSDRTVVTIVAAIAALIAIIGSVLPWLTASDPFSGEQISWAGTRVLGVLGGKTTLILAVVALLTLGMSFLRVTQTSIKPVSIFVLLLGAAITSVAIYKLVDLEREFAADQEFAAIAAAGVGLYMVLIGGLVLTACAGFSVYRCLRDANGTSE